MSTAVAQRNGNGITAELMGNVLIKGDLSQLTQPQRNEYYLAVCKSAGLNPLTKPFEYLQLNGKTVLYALRSCTDQLRSIHEISVVDMSETERDGVYVVTCKVANADGRTDMAKGAVNIANLKGEALANAIMKAETKAKRRATLSICGLGLLDETEVEDIPSNVKTLPKKDARDIYAKLQNDINLAQSPEGLKDWGERQKERIAVLPPDWQDILRARFHEKLVELKQLGADDEPKEDVPTDPEAFLKWADAQLAAVDDAGMLEQVYTFKIDVHSDKLLPPDQAELVKMYQKHETRLAHV